jgi:Uma2 family endonuclease
MSTAYEELLQGESHLRQPPGERHERICRRLHGLVGASVDGLRSTQLLRPRFRVVIAPRLALCPDLALLATATGRLWLAAEIIDGQDHHVDTVLKKQIYEDLRIPRLWMIDPRYDNVEVYHATPYGLSLKGILAGKEVLSEPLLPEFEVNMKDLFAA